MKTNRSWFKLITFCVVMAFATALGLSVFLTSASVAFAGGDTPSFVEANAPSTPIAEHAPSPESTDQTAISSSDQRFSGLITDEICGPRHDMGSGKTAAECANICVRNGAKYALIDSDNKFTLDGKTEDLARLAGQRVIVDGNRNGSNIRVTSVSIPSVQQQ